MTDLQVAVALADIADGITLKNFRKSVRVRQKEDSTPVTNVDVEVQEQLAGYLKKHLPEDGILAEESTAPKPSHNARRWVIDPLDHTDNYIRGIQCFATLIALEFEHEPVVSIISAPAIKRRWWATKDGGAHADGYAISVSGIDNWADSYMSFAAIHEWDSRGLLRNIAELARTAQYTTGSGGFFWHMQVAEGRLDASLDPWGEPWDNAAVRHIVEEAGGRFTDIKGSRTIFGGSAIVTNGRLHDYVLNELQ